MDPTTPQEAEATAATTDLQRDNPGNDPPLTNEVSQGGSQRTQFSVLVELLRQVAPQVSEEPEEILRFFVRLAEVHELGLVDDRQFVIRILPLVSGTVLKFLGGCLRQGCSWAECRSKLLEDYFPYFVRERLLRDLIVFNFHAAVQPMRSYVEQVFRAAYFLQYQASEKQVVERILMNLHPDIAAKAAIMDTPRSLKELYCTIGLSKLISPSPRKGGA